MKYFCTSFSNSSCYMCLISRSMILNPFFWQPCSLGPAVPLFNPSVIRYLDCSQFFTQQCWFIPHLLPVLLKGCIQWPRADRHMLSPCSCAWELCGDLSLSSRSEPSMGTSGLWCLCAVSAWPDGEAASLLRFLRRQIKALLLRYFCGRTMGWKS